jgi:hypothetical protein
VVNELQADHLVNLAAVQRLLEQHKSGTADHSRRIWTLLVLLLWHGIFVEQRIRPVGLCHPAPKTPAGPRERRALASTSTPTSLAQPAAERTSHCVVRGAR